MRMSNNKSGFTLLEIIIVIIIVGVLASLALPRFFNTIAYSRSTEALNAIGVVKRAADRCAMASQAQGGAGYSDCSTFNELGIEDPSAAPGSYFTAYALDTTSLPDYIITATSPDGTITFTNDTASQDSTRAGTNAYSGLK